MSPNTPPVAGRGSAYGTLARNTVATLAGRTASVAVAIVLSTVVFRALGPRQYGLWSLLMMVASYSMLLDFGLSAAVERRVAKLWVSRDPAGIDRTLNAVLTVVVLALAAVQALCLVAVPRLATNGIVGADSARALFVVPVCMGLTTSGLLVGAGLSGLQQMGVLHLWRTVCLVLSSVAVIAALSLGVRRVDALLLLYALGGLVAAGAQWRALRRWLPALRLRPLWDGESVADLFRFGGVLQVATMAPPLSEYAFRVVVGARFGLEYAGAYDLAARAAVTLRSLAGSLFAAMVPFGVHALAEGRAAASRLVRLATRFTGLFIVPLSVVMVYHAGALMRLWLGSGEIVPAVSSAFAVLVIAHAIGALTVPAAMLGRAAGKPVFEAATTAVSFAAAVALSAWAPSLTVAAALFWGIPALGGAVLWAWLTRTLEFRFDSGPDLAMLVLLAAIAYGATAALAWLLTRAGVGSPVLNVLAGSVATLVLTGCAALLVGAVRWRETAQFLSAIRRES